MSISLKIKGNKYSNEGVGIDHVAIGDPAFIVVDRQYPPINRSGYGIVIRHYADKSVYTMVIANVTSADGSRQGSLYIAVAVPRGEYVAGLYNLLVELADFYRQTYMSRQASGYCFTERRENVADFQAILNRHAVSRYPYRPVVSNSDMDSIAYVCAPVADIAAILNDPMRPEFAKFGQVVLLPGGNPTEATLSVTPHMCRDYALVVNGKKVSAVVSDPNKPLNVSVPGSSTFQPASVRFTINEARAGAINGASVTIDDFAQVVTINVHQRRNAAAADIHTEAPGPRKSSNGKRMLPFIFAGVVVAVLACVYFLMFANKDDKQQPIATSAGNETTNNPVADANDVNEQPSEGNTDATDSDEITQLFDQDDSPDATTPPDNATAKPDVNKPDDKPAPKNDKKNNKPDDDKKSTEITPEIKSRINDFYNIVSGNFQAITKDAFNVVKTGIADPGFIKAVGADPSAAEIKQFVKEHEMLLNALQKPSYADYRQSINSLKIQKLKSLHSKLKKLTEQEFKLMTKERNSTLLYPHLPK